MSASGPTGSQGSDEGGRIHHALALDEIRGPHAGGQGRVQLVRVGADDRFGRHRLPAGSHLPLDVQMVPRLRWIEPYPDHAALLGLTAGQAPLLDLLSKLSPWREPGALQ